MKKIDTTLTLPRVGFLFTKIYCMYIEKIKILLIKFTIFKNCLQVAVQIDNNDHLCVYIHLAIYNYVKFTTMGNIVNR